MNKFTKIILPILVVLGLGYSGYWYFKSDEVEKKVRSDIESLASDRSHGFRFQYDKIEKSGFPTDVKIVVKNPQFKFLNPENESAKPAELNIDGSMNYVYDLAGNLKSSEIKGKTHLIVPDDKEGRGFNVLVEGNLDFDLETSKLLSYEFLNQLAKGTVDFDRLWREQKFENRYIKVDNIRVLNADDNQLLLSIGHGALKLDRKEESEEHQKLFASINIKDLQYGNFTIPRIKEGEIAFEEIPNILHETLMAKSGKTNYDFELVIDLPNGAILQEFMDNPGLFALANRIPQVGIHLKKFDNDNSFGKSSASGYIRANEDDQKNVKIETYFVSDYKYTPVLQEALSAAVDALKQNASQIQAETEEQKKFVDALVNHTDDVKALIPQFDRLGKMELNKEGVLDFNKGSFRTNVTLKRLEFLSDLYSAKLNGDLFSQGASNYTGEFHLNLIKYAALVKDIAGYYNRVIVFLNDMQGPNSFNQISESNIERIITYLRNISNEPKSDSRDLTITSSYKDGEAKIGTLSLQEFAQKSTELGNNLSQELAPNLPEGDELEKLEQLAPANTPKSE